MPGEQELMATQVHDYARASAKIASSRLSLRVHCRVTTLQRLMRKVQRRTTRRNGHISAESKTRGTASDTAQKKAQPNAEGSAKVYSVPIDVFIISFSIAVLFSQTTHVNLVDLVKNFQTSIQLKNSASIQARTSRSKFADTYLPPGHKYRSGYR